MAGTNCNILGHFYVPSNARGLKSVAENIFLIKSNKENIDKKLPENSTRIAANLEIFG
jgi:hypothetical protein